MKRHMKRLSYVFVFLFAFMMGLVSVSAQFSNPSVHYKFDEVDGTNIAESVKGSPNMTIVQPAIASFGPGIFGHGLDMNGSAAPVASTETAGGSDFAFGTGNFSIIFWINGTAGSTHGLIELRMNNADSWGVITGGGDFYKFQSGDTERVQSGTALDSQWHRVAFVRENTGTGGLKAYLDGVNTNNGTDATNFADNTNPLNISKSTDGNLDDLRIYKGYALNQSEITRDFESATDLVVTLNTLADNIALINASSIFNATITTGDVDVDNITNATLYIWNQNGSIFNLSTNSMNGISNSTIFNITNLVVGNFKWNVLGCGQNATGTVCIFAEANRTFDYGYFINSRTFTTPVGDLTNTSFILNLTLHDSVIFSSSSLFYDGTFYSTTSTTSGNENIFTRILDIPAVLVEEIRNFHWVIVLTDSFNAAFNTTQQSQTVTPSVFTNCNSTFPSMAVNFSIHDEETEDLLNISNFDVSYEWSLASGGAEKNSSNALINASQYQFCVDPGNTTFFVDSIIRLRLSGYDERTYVLSQEQYNNHTPSQKFLYMLNSSVASDIIIEVKDTGLQPLPGYTVKIFRQNPDTGVETLVEQDVTGDFGQIVASLVQNNIKYRFLFYDEDNVLVKTTGLITIACRSLICVVPFIVQPVIDDFDRFDNVTDFDYSLSFSNNTNIVTYTWNDNTGDIATHRLEVRRFLFNGTTTVCDTSSTATSGSLTCDVGDQLANYFLTAFRSVDGEERTIAILNIKVEKAVISGREGLFWSFILLFTMIAIGIFSPVIAITLYVIGVIVLGTAQIIYVDTTVMIAHVIIGGLFYWGFKT